MTNYKCPNCGNDKVFAVTNFTVTTQLYNQESGNYGAMDFGKNYRKDVVCNNCAKIIIENKHETIKAKKELTHRKEFFLTGAFAQGIEINGKKYLIVTQIEDDSFCGGKECNDRIKKEYTL